MADQLDFLHQHRHIVKSYEDDLSSLNTMLTHMGSSVRQALHHALMALEQNDAALAQQVIEGEGEIDRQENAIDTFAVRILALRQPVAQDLRYVITAIKISAHLERIADYAEHIATRQSSLAPHIQNYPQQLKLLLSMGHEVNTMLDSILQAFTALDVELAQKVWHHDDVVDGLYGRLMQDTKTILQSKPDQAPVVLHMLFMAKNIERMGDHITNIAEHVHYLVEGKLWKDAFPRGGADS